MIAKIISTVSCTVPMVHRLDARQEGFAAMHTGDKSEEGPEGVSGHFAITREKELRRRDR